VDKGCKYSRTEIAVYSCWPSATHNGEFSLELTLQWVRYGN